MDKPETTTTGAEARKLAGRLMKKLANAYGMFVFNDSGEYMFTLKAADIKKVCGSAVNQSPNKKG